MRALVRSAVEDLEDDHGNVALGQPFRGVYTAHSYTTSMPGLSKVIVVDPDARARRQIQLGFEREGVPTVAPEITPAPLELPAVTEAGLVVVGGADGRALEFVRTPSGWERLRPLPDLDLEGVTIADRGRGRVL